MKKPLFASFIILATTAAAGVAGLRHDPAPSRLKYASGVHFLDTGQRVPFFSSVFRPLHVSPGSQLGEETKPVKKVELVVLETGTGVEPGSSRSPASPRHVKLGFFVELEPDWHIYWVNPGDAGLAPSVRWTLPPGFTAGPLRHPLPRKSVEEGIVSFEHEGPVLLICDISPPATARPSDKWEAAAVLEWMACHESCIVGETAAKVLYPPDAAAREKGRALFERFAPRFPRPASEAGLAFETARAEFTGEEWRVETVLAGPRAAAVEDFFPYPVEDFVVVHSDISCREGRIILPLTPSRGPGVPPPRTIRGLVIVDGAGYEATIPVASRPHLTAISTHSVMSWR